MLTRRARVASTGGVRVARQAAITVLVADATRMDGQLLRGALIRSPYSFDVIGCAVSRPELLAQLAERPADVILLNEELEGGGYAGFQALSEVRSHHPSARSVMLLRAPTRELVVEAFRLGAKGVFSRSEAFDQLCKCIYVVHTGQIWASSDELQYLTEALSKTPPQRLRGLQGDHLLGPREDEVAHLVAQGMTNREIACTLRLSEHTVGNYLFRIYEKLGISSRVELVLYTLAQRAPGP